MIYSAPGTSKYFLGQLVVSYVITQGLNVISTALMGVSENSLGGIHLYKLFQLPTDGNYAKYAFRCAKLEMQEIKRKPVLLHAIHTLGVLFIDEAGQVSSEKISAIYIILCKEHES